MYLSRLVITLIAFGIASLTNGQTHLITFDVLYPFNYPIGNGLNQTNKIRTESLFQKFQNRTGGSIGASWSLSSDKRIGVSYEFYLMKNWRNQPFDIYKDAAADIMLVGPYIEIDLKEFGIIRKSTLGFNINPVVGQYRILLNHDIYSVYFQGSYDPTPFSEKGLLAGIKSNIYFKYYLTKNISLNLKLGFKYFYMKSLLCTDRNNFIIAPEIGLKFSFIKNKTLFIY